VSIARLNAMASADKERADVFCTAATPAINRAVKTARGIVAPSVIGGDRRFGGAVIGSAAPTTPDR